MSKGITAIASLLMLALPGTSGAMLAVPATSGAADQGRWMTYPTCTATSTLTCSGKAAIAKPQPMPGNGAPIAAIIAQVRYTCSDPQFDLFWPSLLQSSLGGPYVATTLFHNGQTFSIPYSPPSQPDGSTAAAACRVSYVRNDPNYYNVSVVVGWGFGGGLPITVLEAAIGTVSPQ
jgi:hypothetical protein